MRYEKRNEQISKIQEQDFRHEDQKYKNGKATDSNDAQSDYGNRTVSVLCLRGGNNGK